MIDYYVRYKEEHEAQATSVSKEKVKEVESLFNGPIGQLVHVLGDNTNFYLMRPDAYDEAKKRVGYLKHVIEDKDGYKLSYLNGNPIKREVGLQLIYRLVWYGTTMDGNREVNNGRGPVDYNVSYGVKN